MFAAPEVQLGIKEMLNFSRDHNVEDSLRYSLAWNAAFVQSTDTKVAGAAFVFKTDPQFPDAQPLIEPASTVASKL